MQTQTGILTVVSGFSGSGKGTIMKRLMEKYPENYALSISATTRSPRPGETDGKEYFFCTKERFDEMIAAGELLEYARYVDNYYGTPRAYVQEQLEKGRDVILEIEIQGARDIKRKFPDSVLLFVTPPSFQELEQRLIRRATEPPQVVRARLNRACEECEGIEAYDYLIVNDKLEACVEQVHSILQNEHTRLFRREAFIKEMKQSFMEYAKGE